MPLLFLAEDADEQRCYLCSEPLTCDIASQVEAYDLFSLAGRSQLFGEQSSGEFIKGVLAVPGSALGYSSPPSSLGQTSGFVQEICRRHTENR